MLPWYLRGEGFQLINNLQPCDCSEISRKQSSPNGWIRVHVQYQLTQVHKRSVGQEATREKMMRHCKYITIHRKWKPRFTFPNMGIIYWAGQVGPSHWGRLAPVYWLQYIVSNILAPKLLILTLIQPGMSPLVWLVLLAKDGWVYVVTRSGSQHWFNLLQYIAFQHKDIFTPFLVNYWSRVSSKM